MEIEIISKNFFTSLAKGFVSRDTMNDLTQERISLFRQALDIKPEDYVKIMKTISSQVDVNNSFVQMTDIDIFRFSLEKAFTEKVLLRKQQDIIKSVAEILMISREDRVKVLRTLNYRGATEDEEKNGVENYTLHDFILVQSLVPEVLIKIRTKDPGSGFIGNFVRNTGTLCLFYYEDQERFFIALGDASGMNICFRHELNSSEREDLVRVFSRELLDAYIIKLIRGNKTYTIYRAGKIDLTGNHYRGLELLRDQENQDSGINCLIKAAEMNEKIYGINLLIGQYYLEREDLPQATKFLYKEERMFPENTGSAALISRLFEKRSKPDRASEYATKSLKNDPFCPKSLLDSISNRLSNLEENLDKVFSYLLLAIVLYPEDESVIEILLQIKSKLQINELEILMLEENKDLVNPVKKFQTIRLLFLAGYYSIAVILCQEFIEEYEKLLQDNLIFRIGIRDFLFFQITNIPDKTVVGALEVWYAKL